jgi:hypothetical protein
MAVQKMQVFVQKMQAILSPLAPRILSPVYLVLAQTSFFRRPAYNLSFTYLRSLIGSFLAPSLVLDCPA